MKRAISLILVALMALMLVPAISVAADDAVVYLNGATGADTNDGKTAATAVATIDKAIEVANTFTGATEVVIVLAGETAIPNAQHVLPANNAPIVLTSIYAGTDYKAQGAKLVFYNGNCAAIHFNGDAAIENLNIEILNDNPIFALQYNSFTVGEGVEITSLKSPTLAKGYPIILIGCNTQNSVAQDKAATPTTFTNDVNVEVNSGTWAYIRGGDRDSMSTFDGNMTIDINGGTFMCPVTSATGHYGNGNVNGPTGKCSYGPNAKIVMNLKGGEMDSLIGCSYVGNNTGHTSAADITINIFDGFKLTNKFVAVQTTNTVFNGKLTVNLYGGDLTGLVEAKLLNASVANGGTGTVTVNYDANDAKSAAAFKALKDVNLDDTDVIYGALAAAPVVTEAPATEAPVVTDAPATTTEAPAQPEDTPATGDASVMVVFAAAAVLSIAAVVVIKKREN